MSIPFNEKMDELPQLCQILVNVLRIKISSNLVAIAGFILLIPRFRF